MVGITSMLLGRGDVWELITESNRCGAEGGPRMRCEGCDLWQSLAGLGSETLVKDMIGKHWPVVRERLLECFLTEGSVMVQFLYPQVLYPQSRLSELCIETICIKITSVLNVYTILHHGSLNNTATIICIAFNTVVDLIYLGG